MADLPHARRDDDPTASIAGMVSRLQKVIVLSVLLGVLLWAAAAVYLGHSPWAAGGLALVLGGYVLFMAGEFMVMAWRHGDDPAPKARLVDLLRAWLGEVTTAPFVFCWWQPFRSQRFSDHLPLDSTARAVVLVHGFLCNRGLWNRWLPRLRALDIPFVAVTLEQVFGSIDDAADSLEPAVRRAEQVTGRKPLIVAHSMGGLVARAWMAKYGGAERVHRVITIGTPHRGTWTARHGHTINAIEMRQGSDFLKSLERREAGRDPAQFTCFYSHCDNIVYPASTATLEGADNRHLPGRAHVHLMDHDDVFAEVVEQARRG